MPTALKLRTVNDKLAVAVAPPYVATVSNNGTEEKFGVELIDGEAVQIPDTNILTCGGETVFCGTRIIEVAE